MDVSVKGWQPPLNEVDELLSGSPDFAIGYSSMIADYVKGKPLRLVMHCSNLQINGLIDKENAVVDKPIREIASSGDLTDFINRNVDVYAT